MTPARWRFAIVRVRGEWTACFVLPGADSWLVYVDGERSREDVGRPDRLAVHEEVGPRRQALLDERTIIERHA